MTREELKKNTISYCVNIKYLDYDDIQWDILGMSSNKQEPLLLRATGAFSLFSSHLVAEKYLPPVLKGEYKNGCC